jgi:hypothetical protein
MSLGGPVWHASVSGYSASSNRTAALLALLGVGDVLAGQWEENGFEQGGIAYHIRRRLSASEAAQVGPVIDIRGTPEAARRLRLVAHLLPPGYSE